MFSLNAFSGPVDIVGAKQRTSRTSESDRQSSDEEILPSNRDDQS